jgi:hypothetical protein
MMSSQENKHVTQKEHDADHTTSCRRTVSLPVVHKVLYFLLFEINSTLFLVLKFKYFLFVKNKNLNLLFLVFFFLEKKLDLDVIFVSFTLNYVVENLFNFVSTIDVCLITDISYKDRTTNLK